MAVRAPPISTDILFSPFDFSPSVFQRGVRASATARLPLASTISGSRPTSGDPSNDTAILEIL